MNSSQHLEQLTEKFMAMPDNDRRMLSVLAVFLICVVCYMGLTASFEYRNKGVESLEDGRELVWWTKMSGYNIKRAKLKNPKQVQGTDESLLSIASSTAKQFKLNFKRLQPEGDTLLRITMEDSHFNHTLKWLYKLQNLYGITVQKISVDKGKRSGYVNISLTVERPLIE